MLSGLMMVGIFSSCISSEEINYLQNINLQYPLQPYTEYRLAVDDKISCSISTSDEEVFRAFNSVVGPNQNALKAYTIYSDSTVILPFFGKVKVAGSGGRRYYPEADTGVYPRCTGKSDVVKQLFLYTCV